MSALPTVLWSLILAGGGAVVLYVLNVIFQLNLRKVFEYFHLDSILIWLVKYAREHKIFWFLVGLLSGALLTSVAFPYLTAANEPYINPIHDSRVKWNMVKWISGDKEPCHTVLVIFPDAYAEDYANDWKEIFTVIRWPSPNTIANATIEKGISFRPIQADARAVACAKTLNTMFSYFSVSKRGSPIGGNFVYGYQTGEAVPTYLKECTSPCVEMDLGNPREDQ
jgi:hypothetical protein